MVSSSGVLLLPAWAVAVPPEPQPATTMAVASMTPDASSAGPCRGRVILDMIVPPGSSAIGSCDTDGGTARAGRESRSRAILTPYFG
jgi:hypothetical protein